jgi:hypothetical protein
MINEQTSMLDCHQDGLVPDPESWILAWMLLSFSSSLIFLITLCVANNLGFLKVRRDKICTCSTWMKKASFVSFTFLIIPTVAYYGIRIKRATLSKKSVATSVFLLIWPLVMWVVVLILNYTRNRSDCCKKVLLFYWVGLAMYLCETAFKTASVMLDVAYDIAPLVDPGENFKALILILSGFRLAFHSRLLTFFWEKLFHGDKDLFCSPCSNVDGEHICTSNKKNEIPSANEVQSIPT